MRQAIWPLEGVGGRSWRSNCTKGFLWRILEDICVFYSGVRTRSAISILGASHSAILCMSGNPRATTPGLPGDGWCPWPETARQTEGWGAAGKWQVPWLEPFGVLGWQGWQHGWQHGSGNDDGTARDDSDDSCQEAEWKVVWMDLNGFQFFLRTWLLLSDSSAAEASELAT